MSRLAKLAKVSATLRAGATKEAGLLGSLTGMAVKNPVMTAMAGAGVVGGAKMAKGKSDTFKKGFDPTVNQAMLGIPPQPPGST